MLQALRSEDVRPEAMGAAGADLRTREALIERMG